MPQGMRKKIAAALAAGAVALSVPAAALASGNPHAGNSGHFKGSATPCKQSENNPNCPPFGDG